MIKTSSFSFITGQFVIMILYFLWRCFIIVNRFLLLHKGIVRLSSSIHIVSFLASCLFVQKLFYIFFYFEFEEAFHFFFFFFQYHFVFFILSFNLLIKILIHLQNIRTNFFIIIPKILFNRNFLKFLFVLL